MMMMMMMYLLVAVRVPSEHDPDVCRVIVGDRLELELGVRRPRVEGPGQLLLYILSALQFGTPVGQTKSEKLDQRKTDLLSLVGQLSFLPSRRSNDESLGPPVSWTV